MKNFLLILFLTTCSLFLITGCGENSQATPAEVKEAASVKNSVTIQINGKNFSATLEDNPTAKKLLFGSNCLVLFYKDFTTGYSYTRLGKLDNPADLKKILGGLLDVFGKLCRHAC